MYTAGVLVFESQNGEHTVPSLERDSFSQPLEGE